VKHLLIELRRRRVFRTAALYIVGAWLVLQVGDVVFPALDIPERALRYVLFGAVLCFPAILVFGWFFDIGADGIRRTQPAGPGEAAASLPFRRVYYGLLVALLAVAAAIVYSMAGRVVDEPTFVREGAGDGPPMVAVLPFTAASIEGDSEFFATGVHDDLLTQLAQLESVRVISRTSVLEYKDVTRNIREIGAQLGADVILEGGVQSAGERIRINAQLIDARTDEHLWAQTYDRELTATNIFDVQSEIARAITAAMHTTLTPQDVTQLTIIPTENMAAYREYRRAVEIRNTERVWKNEGYRQALERAIELDPTFTRAMADLVGHLTFTNFFHQEDTESIPRAEEVLEQIRNLAPDSVDHLLAKFFYSYYTLKDYEQAYAIIQQAERLAPSDTRILGVMTWIQRRLGDFAGRIEVIKKLMQLDPRNPQHVDNLGWNLLWTHQYDEALAAADATEFDSYNLDNLRSMLSLREHRDIGRLTADLEAIQDKYPANANPMVTWEARIGNRDFEGAEEILAELDTDESDIGVYLSEQTIARIITYWFLGYEDRLSEILPAARAFLEQSRQSDGTLMNFGTYQTVGLIDAVEGNREAAVMNIQLYLHEARQDMTDYSSFAAETCQTLAMAGATTATVDCLREAFVKPSNAFPFLEPLLPHYDPIRDDPAFVELLAEIE
jgi:TolB-like protein/tetratricopeptide (TPR) repeat protein